MKKIIHLLTLSIILSIITLPSVTDMGIRDAIFTLEELGLKVTANGKGYVKQQIPSPGTPYNRGDEVIIILEN